MKRALQSIAVAACLLGSVAASAATLDQIAEADAGADLALLETHVRDLLKLVRGHVAAVGLEQALKDFEDYPWKREANALHVWGITTSGVSWFDAGHPELVGLDASNMSDLEGRIWAEDAVRSALGKGDEVFIVVFPHPTTHQAATGLQSCFMLEDGQRTLCTGAFADPS